MVQPKSIITKLFVTVISYAPNGLFLLRPYDHHVMFVNILISILYFAIHVTRLTLNPNVFITRFHFEAHLASNLTGGRFVYWLTSHCITWPTVWIAIFRWAGTSGTSNLLITLNCTFWEWGNLIIKDTPTIMHIVGVSLNVVLRFGSEKSNTKMRKTEINSLRVWFQVLSESLTELHLKSQKYWYSRPGSRFCLQWRVPFSGVGGAEHFPP